MSSSWFGEMEMEEARDGRWEVCRAIFDLGLDGVKIIVEQERCIGGCNGGGVERILRVEETIEREHRKLWRGFRAKSSVFAGNEMEKRTN
jgi:hypothetical protein